ncbi:hypothetical protein [Tomitella fengzijianii]|uniref:hypothetical protein n=1 Tax=Tomitella fengzijianii TaxID=2597660 RepID=UPI0018EEEB94|nr:hypothetical protein [Tomitella fengzijianii]
MPSSPTSPARASATRTRHLLAVLATVPDPRKRRGVRPDESTIRRLFARLDADVLDRALSAYMWTRTTVAGGRRVIAIDGKTVRVRHEVACCEWITWKEYLMVT